MFNSVARPVLLVSEVHVWPKRVAGAQGPLGLGSWGPLPSTPLFPGSEDRCPTCALGRLHCPFLSCVTAPPGFRGGGPSAEAAGLSLTSR